MRSASFVVAVLVSLPVAPTLASGQSAEATPATVVVPSGPLQLKALLWRPVGLGPFPAVLFTHGSGPTDPAKAHRIGPLFAKHGYVFLYLFRRGDGLSSDQGPSLRDLLNKAAAEGGPQARERLVRAM